MIGKQEILDRMATGTRLIIDTDIMSGMRQFMLDDGLVRIPVDHSAARELFESGQITTDDTCACGVSEYRLVLNE